MSAALLRSSGVEFVLANDKALSAGDRAAWQQAIATHNPRVIVALLARRIPLHVAQDLAQEAWAKLFAAAGTLTRIELPGLVIRQALFLAQDAARAGRRFTDAVAEPIFTLTPENELQSKQRLNQARSVLAGLSARTQELFRLCYAEPELSHAAVAERLSVSVQHVRQTLYEVRAEMRATLEKV